MTWRENKREAKAQKPEAHSFSDRVAILAAEWWWLVWTVVSLVYFIPTGFLWDAALNDQLIWPLDVLAVLTAVFGLVPFAHFCVGVASLVFWPMRYSDQKDGYLTIHARRALREQVGDTQASRAWVVVVYPELESVVVRIVPMERSVFKWAMVRDRNPSIWRHPNKKRDQIEQSYKDALAEARQRNEDHLREQKLLVERQEGLEDNVELSKKVAEEVTGATKPLPPLAEKRRDKEPTLLYGGRK